MSAKYRFVTEPSDSLRCLICLEVAENPWQHDKCGKVFCKGCLDRHGKQRSCPNCRARRPRYFEDTRGKRDINALAVKCDNVERNCNWKGTVGTLQNHVAKCDYTLVSCSLKCKYPDGKATRIMRRDVQEHLKNHCSNRSYKCKHCGKDGKYTDITLFHDEICEKKVVPCTNAECTKTMQRRTLESHLQSCPSTEVPCKYAALGCGVKVMRRDKTPHEQDQKSHLFMALDTLVKLQEEKVKLTEEVDTLKYATSSCLTFKVPFHSDADSRFKSPSFYTKRYHLSVSVYKNADMMDDDDDENNDLEDCDEVDEDDYDDDEEEEDDEEEDDDDDDDANDDDDEDDDDDDDDDANDDADDDDSNDDASLDNDNEGEQCHGFIAVCVKLEDGEYDFEVCWPFVGDVTVTLLNQLENKNHHSKTVSFKHENACFIGTRRRLEVPDFISHSALAHDPTMNTQYIKDDTLYFRVDTPDWKPWLQCTPAQ